MNRRDFLASCAVAGLFGAKSGAAQELALRQPVIKQRASLGQDLAILNGRIWTMDERQPRAQAVFVRAGRIVHVGSNAEVRKLAGGVPRFDAGGRAVLPGFIDSHTHMETSSYYFAGLQADIHTPPLSTLEQIFAVMRQKAASTPAGGWVIGRGSYGLTLVVPEKRMPTRLEMDAISDRHPVIVMAGLHGW